MRDTGSITNIIMTNAQVNTAVKPKVGMGATLLYWSDRHAATIIQVSKGGKRIVVKRDIAKRVDNNGYYSVQQQYLYMPDSQAEPMTFSLRKDGTWKLAKTGSISLMIGKREEYFDPHF